MLKMNEIIERILIIVGKVRTKAYNLGIRWFLVLFKTQKNLLTQQKYCTDCTLQGTQRCHMGDYAMGHGNCAWQITALVKIA